MSKKLKVILILILIVLIGAFFCLIRTAYGFYVINSSIKELYNNVEKDNYYLKTTITINGEVSSTEAYYNEGVGKLVSTNGIYTWVDGENAYMVDEENSIIYVLEINEETSTMLVSDEMFVSLIPGYSKTTFQRFKQAASLKNSVSQEEVNGEKCYKISVTEDEMTKTVWITKSRRYPVKGELEFSNGIVIEYEYTLKFYTTKLKDVELPDTTNYTFYDYDTEESQDTDSLETESIVVDEPTTLEELTTVVDSENSNSSEENNTESENESKTEDTTTYENSTTIDVEVAY